MKKGMDIMSLALVLSSISGVVAVETAQAKSYVQDNSQAVGNYIISSCAKTSGLTEIQIKLFNNNMISVTCENKAVKAVLVNARLNGSVNLDLRSGSC